jgi:hypothetical protein
MLATGGVAHVHNKYRFPTDATSQKHLLIVYLPTMEEQILPFKVLRNKSV